MFTAARSDASVAPRAEDRLPRVISPIRGAVSALRRAPASLHFLITLALAVMLLPLGAVIRLSFAPPVGVLALFTKAAFSSVFLAVVLHVINTPLRATIASFRLRPARLAAPAIMGCVFVGVAGWSPGLQITAGAFVVSEFFHRYPTQRLKVVSSFSVPALYLLVVLVLMSYYNAIAASVRNPGAYDQAFMQVDWWFGFDVPAASKHAVALFTPRLLEWAETIYFGMFSILGATLILIALHGGMWRAMRFVGGVALAYYATLVLFLAFPSQGPYSLCVDHASSFPSVLQSYPIHFALLDEAARLYQHSATMLTSGSYFISFPCMHVVKPTLALWYLRDHKRIGWLLAAYLVMLPIAIVLLEMHYVVDIPVGFAIAGVVLVVSDSDAMEHLKRLVRERLSPGRSAKSRVAGVA